MRTKKPIQFFTIPPELVLYNIGSDLLETDIILSHEVHLANIK
jgi:hypothetical protein